MDGFMDECMELNDEWMDRWVADGWTDGQIHG